jgi:hypothetical protein
MAIDAETILKRGDLVSITGTVEYVDTEQTMVSVRFPGMSSTYPDRAELTLVRQAFTPGERVIHEDDHEDYYIIVAVDGDEAWVRKERGSRAGSFAQLKDLRRIPPDEARVAAEWKPMQGHNPVAAVLDAINADPNVSPEFKGGANGAD